MNTDYYHTSKFDLYLALSQLANSGLGVYTREFIPANTLIDEYCGSMTSSLGGSYVLYIKDRCYIDALGYPRCFMGMINDASYVPKKIIRKKKKKIDKTPDANYDVNNNKLINNCEFVIDKENEQAFVHTLCDISPGSELFVSYGTEYWN